MEELGKTDIGKALGEVKMDTPCYPPQKESLPSFVLDKKLEFILFKKFKLYLCYISESNCAHNMYSIYTFSNKHFTT